jgi:hypothetical protein
MLYEIREPLRDKLKNSASEDDYDDYRTRRDFPIHYALLHIFWAASVLLEHQHIWYVGELMTLSISRVIRMKHKWLDKVSFK